MILRDVKLYGSKERKHIHIANGRIQAIISKDSETGIPGEIHTEMEGAIVLPGLINSHDHLDFNLFPQLGNRVYLNYTEWGPDIQSIFSEQIKEVQKIPQELRVSWGVYKNLLNGFTTVINHGEKLIVDTFLVNVFQDCHSLHSPAFEKNWKRKLNNPFAGRKPFVMHMGEGTDQQASREIDEVIRWNKLKRKIIAVHGVAMNEQQARVLDGLVWCPDSNYFLLNATAAVEQLSKNLSIVFGTDSTLTASWNAWEHFRKGIDNRLVNEAELVEMLSSNPARLWNMQDRGKIAEGAIADLLVVKPSPELFSLNPEDILLVITNGIPRLADESIGESIRIKHQSRIRIGGSVKKVQGDLPGLARSVTHYFPAAKFPFTDAG